MSLNKNTAPIMKRSHIPQKQIHSANNSKLGTARGLMSASMREQRIYSQHHGPDTNTGEQTHYSQLDVKRRARNATASALLSEPKRAKKRPVSAARNQTRSALNSAGDMRRPDPNGQAIGTLQRCSSREDMGNKFMNIVEIKHSGCL